MKVLTGKALKRWNLVVISITAVIFTTIFIIASSLVNTVNANNLEQTVFALKKDLVHDTVNNQIQLLEGERSNRENEYLQKNGALKLELDNIYTNYSDTFLTRVKSFFNDSRRPHFYTYIYDTQLGQTVYTKAFIDSHQGSAHTIYTFPPLTTSIDEYYATLGEDFFSYQDLIYGNYKIFTGTPKYYIEKEMADFFRQAIYSMSFEDDNTYLWVNKILLPSGGDNYGQRIIHPNLKSTEYSLLSTSTLDYLGENRPYQTELEGVLDDDGEVFFTYSFKLLNSEEVGEKLTYSKLYEPYDWIIAMGIYLEDIAPFMDDARRQSMSATSILVVTFLLASIALFTTHYFMIGRLQKQNLAFETSYLHEEISRDQLTNARSRKALVVELENYFNLYQASGESIGLLYFDFDNFKDINDKYGHDVGDKVLIGVTQNIRNYLRTTDHLYRIGGDEFVICFVGLKKENAKKVADTIIDIAKRFTFECSGNITINPTISVGAAFFNKNDQDYNDTLKRADKALYLAKNTKKGTSFIDLD